MGAQFNLENLITPLMTGLVSRIASTKAVVDQARALTVVEIQNLEHQLENTKYALDRYYIGCLLFAVYSRSRWSDMANLDTFEFDIIETSSGPFGFVEGRSRIHKTATSEERKTLYMPFVAPIWGITATPWGVNFKLALEAVGDDRQLHSRDNCTLGGMQQSTCSFALGTDPSRVCNRGWSRVSATTLQRMGQNCGGSNLQEGQLWNLHLPEESRQEGQSRCQQADPKISGIYAKHSPYPPHTYYYGPPVSLDSHTIPQFSRILRVTHNKDGGEESGYQIAAGIPWSEENYIAEAADRGHPANIFQGLPKLLEEAIHNNVTSKPESLVMKRAQWFKKWTSRALQLSKQENELRDHWPQHRRMILQGKGSWSWRRYWWTWTTQIWDDGWLRFDRQLWWWVCIAPDFQPATLTARDLEIHPSRTTRPSCIPPNPVEHQKWTLSFGEKPLKRKRRVGWKGWRLSHMMVGEFQEDSLSCSPRRSDP